jgi:thiosulfate/3-mercaptopyruvate sulfurtransferase
MHQNQISADQLMGILDQNPVIIDCRFQLNDPEAGRRAYLVSHLPGAFYAHLDEDCAGVITPSTGRHPLPEIKTFLHTVATWGIHKDSQVVLYDDKTGAMAARLWWMLKNIGVINVAILDGGFNYWQITKLPLNTVVPALCVECESIACEAWNYVSTTQMQSLINDPNYFIIDARAPERYAGLEESIDPIAGHIPNAANRFHGLNYTAEGFLKPTNTLRDEYTKLIGDFSPDHVIFYCGSGVTSCVNILSMEHAGLPGAKLYIGSWSEWIRNPKNPLITRS